MLLDAGAGDVWKYEESGTGLSYPRSEGIAVASIRMFEDGQFQSRDEIAQSVDGMSPLADVNSCRATYRE